MAVRKGHFSIQVQDYNPTVRAVTQYFTDSAGLLANMDAAIAAYLPLLDAVVAGQILKAQIVIPVTLPGGLKAAAVADENNSVTALFDWLNATNTDKYGVAYPGWYTANPGHGFEVAHPSIVNQSDAAVAAFISGNDVPVGTVALTDEDGQAFTGFSRAIKSGRSTRKQLARAK